MRKFFLSSMVIFLSQYGLYAAHKSMFDEFFDETKTRIDYYKPYIVAGSLLVLATRSNKTISSLLIGAATLYSMHGWYTGFVDIQAIEHKYKRSLKPHNHWSDKPQKEIRFLFCRWRQQDDQFGDGIYWPTAWWMNNHRNEIIAHLIKDICSNRIVLIEGDQRIASATPYQVLRAINDELMELEKDKEILKRYTNIHRTISLGEEFKPDNSYWRIFWPNYNYASGVYIDIVTMIKRLEILREIISDMKLGSGGNGWPRVR